MDIVAITEQNADAFATLAPEGYALFGNDRHALGAVESSGDQNYAVGILNFNLQEGGSGDEDVNLAVVDWLFVDPRLRRQGVGTFLVNKVFEILYRVNASNTEQGIDGVLCDIPMDERYESLGAFLKGFGFGSGQVNLPEAYFTLRDFTEHPKLKRLKISSKNIKPLSKIEPVLLTMYLSGLEDQAALLGTLSIDADAYEKELSFVSVDAGQLDGALLVRKSDLAGTIELLHLSGTKAKLCSELVFASIKAGETIYPPETPVAVRCITDQSANLLVNLFPDLTLSLVRRMTYDLAAEFELEEVH
jgi:GNAT superfamily N-acetyltransferase